MVASTKTWNERQLEFMESKLITKGQKMVWVRGGAAQGANQFPLETVWFVRADKYNWIVVDQYEIQHTVLPDRLLTVWQIQDWMERYRNLTIPRSMTPGRG